MKYSPKGMQLSKLASACLLCVAANTAVATPINVSFVASSASIYIYIGDTFTVDLVADIFAPAMGWGLDVISDVPTVISQSATPLIGASWIPAFSSDGDGLAGFAPFGSNVMGLNVLLATLTFDAMNVGITNLSASISDFDFSEGFPEPFPAAPGSFYDVCFQSLAIQVSEAVTSVPEPSSLAWGY